MTRLGIALVLLISSICFATTAPICDVTCAPDPSGGSGYVLPRTYSVNARGMLNATRPLHRKPPRTVKNIGSQSYNYAIPILHLPGRNHLDLDLTLFYNSAVWSMDAPDSSATFNADRDWPSYGFRLDFGYVEFGFDVNGNYMYVLTQPDGSKHRVLAAQLAMACRLSREC